MKFMLTASSMSSIAISTMMTLRRFRKIPITLIANNIAKVTGDDAKSLLKLIDMIEDSDDVQKVHSNYEIPEEELSALES